ncbi:MAG: SMC-Scp complex subunit ScpB [Oscillospiraceae bacterium]|nr:SMC-Scp complex subunit ScpB [Oscillospiraceae bacterium]
MTEQERLAAMTEAILFSAGEPVEISRIARTLGILERDAVFITELLQDRYAETNSALQILHLGNSVQIGTKPEFAAIIRTALETKRMQPLSSAAMEVLTIIAYNQPVSKNFVARVRGIDSSSIVNSLHDKGLLEEAGRIDVPGRPVAYRTTDVFLRSFGLHSLEDLPALEVPVQDGEFTGEISEKPEQDVTA